METCTSGSEGGPRKRNEGNLDTAPRSNPYSYCRVGDSFWYLIAIIDMFSRKIVGHAVRPSATSDDVKDTFDKALAKEGLLAMGSKMPKSLSVRDPQMRSKTIRRFFYDLGITQMFARPRTQSVEVDSIPEGPDRHDLELYDRKARDLEQGIR
jgi:transposase InsO family protein